MNKSIYSFLLVIVIIFLSINDDFTLTEKSFSAVNPNYNSQVKNIEKINSLNYSTLLCCNNMDPRESTGQQWLIDCSESGYLYIDSICCVNIWAYYNFNNPPASMPCSLVLYLCPVEFD